ncbi:MAG: TetR/AcrR family transcriptional regulator [Lachnospiraceae bacterium]|nr:TetR/AcrR family transcriptional regulator [Lachnospiraceae bacterium]
MTQYPYTEITVKHILLEAGISRKTFYRNFSSKDDVLHTYIDTVLNDYTETLFQEENYSFAFRILTDCNYSAFGFIVTESGLFQFAFGKKTGFFSNITHSHGLCSKCKVLD